MCETLPETVYKELYIKMDDMSPHEKNTNEEQQWQKISFHIDETKLLLTVSVNNAFYSPSVVGYLD